MKYLNLRSSLIAIGMMAVSMSGQAQSATVSFSGTVNTGTCSLTLSQTSGSTTAATSLSITMPTVSTNALSTVGNTAGTTPFYMGLNGCGSTTYSAIKLNLSATATTAGQIDTTVTGVKYQVLDSNSTVLLVSSNPVQTSTYTWTASQTTNSEKLFYVRYYSSSASPASGSPSASLTVTLTYS